MKKLLVFATLIFIITQTAFAELKPSQSYIIPERLTEAEKKDAPRLYGNSVYPGWGVPCTNFTYKAMYQDEKGRKPEYVRINLNNEWHDMKKVSGDYKSGALYTYSYIPTSDKSNFFYFEASNGVGKARAAIIDSPDQGPTLYSEKFDNNQIILLDKNGNEIWAYDTGRDQIEGVAISKDENYVAAVTNYYIYLFSKDSKQPLWKFCTQCEVPAFVSGNMAGIAISADGSYIAADLQGTLYFFEKESKKPLWTRNTESGAIGMDISDDGSLIAVGVANAGEKGDKIFLYDNKGNKLFEYRAKHPGYEQTGNFYQPDMTPDGKYIAISTGCPDRRAYLFSGEGDLIFKSEQLTMDSPVHKSAISDDGSLAVYSLDHAQGKDIVILYGDKGNKLWGFSSMEDSTSRGVSMSADGTYMAAGTSAGNVYLFSKNSNKPLWKFPTSRYTQIGEVKLNSDGSLLAAAGTSKKIYLFSRESNKPLWVYNANTWVTKLDFNGEYIVGGTGLREYMGEGTREPIGEFDCKEVIQIPQMEEMELHEESGEVVCGDSICLSPAENFETCPEDCKGEGDFEEKDKIKESFIKDIKKETRCGNNLCESPQESYETCPQDCCGEDCDGDFGDEDLEERKIEDETRKKGFFQAIIDFLKGLFRK